MGRFKKKPLVIEAFEWTGNAYQAEDPIWIKDALAKPLNEVGAAHIVKDDEDGAILRIHTPEGILSAKPGDWVIRGIAGEIYPCKPSVFDATYESVD